MRACVCHFFVVPLQRKMKTYRQTLDVKWGDIEL
jgi:hypothetical protein